MNDILIAVLQAQWAGGADEHALTRTEVNLGRASDNDVILDDPQVSGHHARITFQGNAATLMDLGSLNGLRLKGQPIPPRTPMPLAPGDVFQIGPFSLRLQPADQRTLPPVAGRVRLSARAGPGLAAYVEGKLLKFPFDKRLLTLGRGAENDIVLPSNYVSRQHAQVMQRDGGWVIVDAGGRNGLTIGGQRVAQHALADGDVIYVGGTDVALQFRASLGFVAADLAPATVAPLSIDLKGRDKITIGRSPDNHVVLDHPQVSRAHALIERLGTRHRIKDLKSANGTFVAGKRIEKEAWLKEGDEIRIGGIRLILREDGIQQFTAEGLRIDALRLNKWVSKEKNLLQDISLCIHPQEFVALVGMSGSGKSTLLDALSGFRPATHGRVAINGVDLYEKFDLFRNEMGYVPQKDIVHQELTVYSALDYAAQLRMPTDTSPAERHKRILEVLQDLDLTERKDLPIHKLSGGQLKRVSIGVELLTKPRLFFLDEPTSGLDPGTEFEMMKLLRKLADQGRTIVLITHATKNVMMCDKVIFLARGGYLAFYGPPEEALPYFDQYRTPQERQQKDIEFDDIYMILGDEKRGKGKDWDQRFRQSKQFRDCVVGRLEAARAPAGAAEATGAHPPQVRSQAGALRQFLILSARNLKIMMADKFGLALMLALAPIIGLMDFMWGANLFDPVDGDPNKIVTMLFMQGLISILVGAMASVREIVKEVDIYRRERAINLKLPSYIMSKVWVGVTLSLYQAIVLLLFLYVFALRGGPLNAGQLFQILITMFLGTLSGYLMGLAISAAAPNQNVALLLVIVVLVPQFLFAGALLPLDLIPGGQFISAVASTRWAFEAMVNTSALGKDIVDDPCWQWVEKNDKQPSDLTQDEKLAKGCRCMGVRLFTDCSFPGIRNPDFYTEEARRALAAPQPAEPPKPTPYPSPTPYPTLTPLPTYTPLPTLTPLPTPADPSKMSKYMDDSKKQGEDYRKLSVEQGDKYRKAREKQGDEYQTIRVQQGVDYEKQRSEQGDEYAAAMKRYGDEREQWQRDREKAISAAESKIKAVVDNFGHTFKGTVVGRWLAMAAIMIVVFVLIIVFQKRKDVI